jgi:hypothetical protein
MASTGPRSGVPVTQQLSQRSCAVGDSHCRAILAVNPGAACTTFS